MNAPPPVVGRTKQLAPHERVSTVGTVDVKILRPKISTINGDTPELRSQYVNSRMEALGERMRNEGFASSESSKPDTIRQDEQKYLARVRRCDASMPRHFRIETVKKSHEKGDVEMDRNAPPYTLYPGKVIGLCGFQKNSQQATIHGMRVASPAPLPTANHERAHQAATSAPKRPRTTGRHAGATRIMVACGPFQSYAASSLAFVKRILKLAVARQVPLVVIFGPLSLQRVHDDVGYMEEDTLVNDFVGDMTQKRPKIIFVPSLQDPFNEFVYPQPQYTMDLEGQDGVWSLPNPAQFEVNNIRFACTSLDVVSILERHAFQVAAGTAALSASSSNQPAFRPSAPVVAPPASVTPSPQRVMSHLQQLNSQPQNVAVAPMSPPSGQQSQHHHQHQHQHERTPPQRPGTGFPPSPQARSFSPQQRYPQQGLPQTPPPRPLQLQPPKSPVAAGQSSDGLTLTPSQRTAALEIVSAGSLYPMLPADPSTPLDVSLAEHLEFQDASPDFIILPSAQPYADVITLSAEQPDDRTVVASPGFFTTHDAGRHRVMDITISASADDEHVWKKTSFEWLILEEEEKLAASPNQQR